VLHRGRIVAHGPPDEVLTADLLGDVFGVRAHRLTHPATGRPLIAFSAPERPGAPASAPASAPGSASGSTTGPDSGPDSGTDSGPDRLAIEHTQWTAPPLSPGPPRLNSPPAEPNSVRSVLYSNTKWRQFGAGGASAAEALEAAGTSDPRWTIQQARRFLEAGASIIMLESEGITEDVPQGEWRTDIAARFVNELGLNNIMFEAADPAVFTWYIRNYSVDVNLFIDHSQIVQLESLRRGIWGTSETWGRLRTYKEDAPDSDGE
jgi:hypothetical protein